MWQISDEPRIPDVPLQASGDRLQVPGVPSTGRPVAEGSIIGLSGDPPRFTQCHGGATVVPRETTPDDMRVSSEGVNRSSSFRRKVQETGHKQANWQAQ